MTGLCSARSHHLVTLRRAASCEYQNSSFGRTQSGFSFGFDCLLRCCLMMALAVWFQSYSGSAASLALRFSLVCEIHCAGVSGGTSSGWMSHHAPSVRFPLASLRLSSSTYTLAYRWESFDPSGPVGTSPVRFTNHFPEANPPTTFAFARQLTVSATGRRSFEVDRRASPILGSWHSVSAESWVLSRSCFLAPPTPPLGGTSCVPPLLK